MAAGPAERLTSKLVEITIDLTLAAVRIVLIVAAAYALTKIARAALNRLESLLVRASATKETDPGSAAKRIKPWSASSGRSASD